MTASSLLAKLGNGAVAGVTGVSIIFPLDMVKTRLQNQKPVNGRLPYRGGVDCFQQIVRNEGVRGLYRGLVPNLAGVTPEKAIKLAVNDIMRGVLADRAGTSIDRLPVMYGALAGATAGLCQVIATNPMEIVKIQMQVAATTQPVSASGATAAATATAAAAGGSEVTAMGIVRQLGIRGLYKGTAATLLRDVPFSFLFFPLQALFAQKIHYQLHANHDKPSTLSVLAGSTVAGIIAAGSVTPADVIKTRLQSSSQPTPAYNGVVDCATRIMKSEGPAAFFKGTVPRCLTMAPLFGIALMMYDMQQKILGCHPISYSDDTIYSGASITTSSNDSATSSNSSIMSRSTLTQKDIGPKQVRRQKSRSSPSNQNHHPNESSQQQYIPRTGHGSAFHEFGHAGEIGGRGLRDDNADSHDNDRQPSHHASPGGVGLSRSLSQHGRSVSLLSRLRHSGASPLAPSPTGSPTSSENSSRDTRSERTLAHSASSGSMRITHQQQQQQRLEVRVLPPTGDQVEDGPSDKAAKRKSSKRRSGSSGSSGGGFISQLLRGHSRHSPQPPSSSGQQQGTAAANVGHFVRSPDTLDTRGPAGAGGTGSAEGRSPAVNNMGNAGASPGRTYSGFGGSYCAPVAAAAADYYTEDSGDTDSQPDSSAIGPNHSAGSYEIDSSSFGHIQPLGLDNSGGALASSQWFEGGDTGNNPGDDPLHMAGRLVSALPVYEPIDMARLTAVSGGSGVYTRATQPMLPDARMLAPMASLAEVFGAAGMGEYSSLSNRELRFAVENHMLVEQHRYLIRDLGHARSAIAALKQVVHAKEERLDHYEAANGDLQQRVAILESVLTPEQRQQVACLPYSFSVYSHASGPSSASHALGMQSMEGCRQEQHSTADGGLGTASSSDTNADPNESQMSTTNSHLSQESDARRANRPLSGYATGFSFNDKPVHHLPRVFSGDYSSADVQAMETSVGVLANAIKSMPRNEHSVEDIIASKLADEKQSQRTDVLAGSLGGGGGNTADEAAPSATDSRKEKRKSRHAQTPSSTSSSPAEPKRRSRFFSALRLSGFGQSSGSMSPATGDTSNAPANRRRSRRSVSLGNGSSSATSSSRESAPASDDSRPAIPNAALPKRVRSDSHESLAASCPSLLPGIIGAGRNASSNRPSSRKPSSGSVSSEGSASGRYPEGLGLGGYGSERSSSSAQASNRIGSNISNSQDADNAAADTGSRGRRSRIANRLSFTPQPRRSTSAPSRPQSMQVARRRSWFSRLFDSGDGRVSDREAPSGNITDDDATDSDMAAAAGKARRRRVMTQSTDEVSQYLGKLKLEDAPSSRGGGGNGLGGRGGGVLEDVIDVSGEDEEQASRPSLSVAEIRQQTLDALNGTVRTGARSSQDSAVPTRISSLPQQRPQIDDGESASSSSAENHLLLSDHNVGRWRQRETAQPTIRRLSAHQAITGANGGSLGLGVSVADRRDAHSEQSDVSTSQSSSVLQSSDTQQSAASFLRRDQPPHARAPSSGSSAGESEMTGSKKWAPAFWAPPPLPFHGANTSGVNSPSVGGGVSSPWSPGESGESFENASSIGSRLSEDARYRSPRGSIGVSTRRGSGNGGSTNGGNASPWELVKIPAESRTFPLSPSHSRPGTPPSRSLGFFEDTTVPDSDELTMAARRSLSLRMSRNAFMQAEPLPESDDVVESSTSSSLKAAAAASGNDNSSKAIDGLVAGHNPVRNAVLARVAASESAQPKRRSLLWQFNSKSTSASGANGNGKVLSGPTSHSNDYDGQQKGAEAASVASDSVYEDADGDNSGNSIHPSADETSLSTTNADAPSSTSNAAGKRSRKWWSAVLG
ncbi:mitochondrial aspartate-glutamate transporter agc1 [Coemansia erecta]|uniref:Mitochondrial aspartate-glutamate transporter agc1 n=1 Tax=Coemansia erecta TaxID=147472 RepID=A0A9W7Y3P3_9FUNG|nr:mitochondrial aspartate-glutamate transporter agc1 [Coemansia erecta]